MADRRHVDAELVGAAGVGLKLDPGGTVAGAFNDAVAAAGGKAVRLVDMHLLATGAGLLSKGQVDEAVLHPRDTDDQRPVDLARGAAGEGFRVIGRSEEHTSELQSLMRISYAVFCLQNQK